MKVIVIFCLCAAVAAHALDVDWGALKSFKDDPRISVNRQLQGKASSRIVNGNEAAPKQFPYQAGLFLYRKSGTYWCGGSIISNRWVLTAAHCTHSLTHGVDVYLGAWHRFSSFEPNQFIIYVPKSNIVMHQMFNSMTLLNDIALIKLPVIIEFNEYIQPVNLPKKSAIYSTYAHKMAITTGWGLHSYKEKHNPDILRWIQNPVLPNKMCAGAFTKGLVTSRNICTDTELGTEACYGDLGGPLVLADGSHTLIGTLSFISPYGCTLQFPNVFTRTTSYLDWIAEKTGLGNN